MKHSTQLVPRETITAIAAARSIALRKMGDAIDHLTSAWDDVKDAFQASKGAHRGHANSFPDNSPLRTLRGEGPDADTLRTAFRKHLDTGVWTYLIDHSGMAEMMDSVAKAEMRATFTGDVPEATEENMTATLQTLFGDIDNIMLRGLAAAFSSLDRRFKSHDGFKIGSRVIVDRLCGTDSGSVEYGNRRDIINDLERIFAVLDGQPPNVGELWFTVNHERRGYGPKQSQHKSSYFELRIFKNGNAHLWFTRKDLVEKVNKKLAAWYGAILPDAAPADKPGDAFKRKAGVPATDLQFYPTPKAVAEELVKGRKMAGKRVLEPSAGEGAICFELLAAGAHVTAVEIDGGRAATLMRIPHRGLEVIHDNFLRLTPDASFDYIVMNPPFFGTHYMEHVVKAFDFLAPGGTLLAVLPVTADIGESKQHAEFHAWIKANAEKWRSWMPDRYFTDLPSGSFRESGTNIETVILEMTRKD